MALKKETLALIAGLTKLKPEDLEAAIKDEKEVDLTIDDKLTAFTEDEITTLKTNEFKRGSVSAVEIAVKDVKAKQGLDFTGKTIEGLIEAANKKALTDAKIEPAKQVQELTEKITNLQKTVTDQEKALADKDTEVTGVKINGELFKHIPAPGENDPAIGADEVIQLMKVSGYDFKLENGALIPYKDGKQLHDKLSNARPVKDVIGDFVKERKLRTETPTPEGRGGGDGKPGSKAGTLSELRKKFEAEGKSVLGVEFAEAVQKAAAENKEFAMDK